jgi:hypothetical protein
VKQGGGAFQNLPHNYWSRSQIPRLSAFTVSAAHLQKAEPTVFVELKKLTQHQHSSSTCYHNLKDLQ